MPTPRKALIWIGILAAVFLLGFLPQFSTARGLRHEVALCRTKFQFAALKNAIGLVYLEANQKNYGIAAQQASRFFETARQTLAATSASGQHSVIQEALSKRDVITAGLARGDPGVIAEIQSVYGNMLRNLPE
jgi:hypothetical protein